MSLRYQLLKASGRCIFCQVTRVWGCCLPVPAASRHVQPLQYALMAFRLTGHALSYMLASPFVICVKLQLGLHCLIVS